MKKDKLRLILQIITIVFESFQMYIFKSVYFWAFILRIFVVIFYLGNNNEIKPFTVENYNQIGTDGHLQIARTLWLTGEYKFTPSDTIFCHNRPPIPPILMLVFGIYSTQYWYLIWFSFQVLLSVFTIFLFEKILNMYKLNGIFYKIALFSFAFHPFLIISVRTTAFLVPAIFLVVLVHYIYILYKNNRKYSYLTFLGISLGLCALTHGTLIILIIPYLLQILDLKKIKIVNIKQGIITILFFILTICPWTIRNYITFNKIIPVATGSGMQYWKGKESVFTEQQDIYSDIYSKETHKKLNIKYFGTVYPQDDEILWDLAIKDMIENPSEVIIRFLDGLFIFWFPHETGYLKLSMSLFSNFALIIVCICLLFTKSNNLFNIHFHCIILFTFLFAFFTPHTTYFPVFLAHLILFISLNLKKLQVI